MTDNCPCSHTKNQILASLSHEAWRGLGVELNAMQLEAGDVLYDAGERVHHHYFPEDCVISLARVFHDGAQIVTATVGCEGMVQLSTAIDRHDTAAMRHVVQIGGSAVRISKDQLAQALQAAPAFKQAMVEYAAGFLSAALLSVACNRAHQVEQRLARWLLLTRDRTASDAIPLTHDDFAEMLGVARPTVTIAAGELEARKLISYKRGRVTILDREGLEGAACECYELCHQRLPATCHEAALANAE